MPTSTRGAVLDVLIDGACPLCRRTARILRRFDWRHRLNFIDADDDLARNSVAPELDRNRALAAMHVRNRATGRLTSGYDACVELARVLPLFWILLPVTHIPGIGAVGRRLYNVIARSRTREGRCTDEICHPPAVPRAPRPAR